jgi:hypothetical protein
MGQLSPRPSISRPLKSRGPKRREMRPPVIGWPTEYASTPPHEFGVVFLCIGFTIEFPATYTGIEIANGSTGSTRISARRFPGEAELGTLLIRSRVVIASGFHQCHFHSGIGQLVSGHAASGTGTYDDDVINILAHITFLIAVFLLIRLLMTDSIDCLSEKPVHPIKD